MYTGTLPVDDSHPCTSCSRCDSPLFCMEIDQRVCACTKQLTVTLKRVQINFDDE